MKAVHVDPAGMHVRRAAVTYENDASHLHMRSCTIEPIDEQTRWHVYDLTIREGTPPLSARIAGALHVAQSDVLASFRRLADAHMLVLQPEGGEILMAGPYSAVPTPFRVRARGVSSYGNCIWDALGIPAMLQSDADIDTSCADCGAAASIRVVDGNVEGEGLMHFALPARIWWKDIVFT